LPNPSAWCLASLTGNVQKEGDGRNRRGISSRWKTPAVPKLPRDLDLAWQNGITDSQFREAEKLPGYYEAEWFTGIRARASDYR